MGKRSEVCPYCLSTDNEASDNPYEPTLQKVQRSDQKKKKS